MNFSPRIVRNFWLNGVVDGTVTRIDTGPKGKDGGFRLTIYQRKDGGVTEALTIEGHAQGDMVKLIAFDSDGNKVLDHQTCR